MLHSCPVAEAVAEAVAAVALQATKELTGHHADTKNFRQLGAPMSYTIVSPLIMDNQMEKKIENEMETGII